MHRSRTVYGILITIGWSGFSRASKRKLIRNINLIKLDCMKCNFMIDLRQNKCFKNMGRQTYRKLWRKHGAYR
jgi:hypothetical protein